MWPIIIRSEKLNDGIGIGQAKAWDEGDGGGCPWKYGPGSWDNGFNSGQQQAIYDHESNVAYNPYPESCQSDVYQHGYHEGYSQQWNSYQQQESTQGSSVNVVNSPGATVSVNQESSQLQNPLQQLVHAACGFINCNPQPQSYEGP
jgi:hypothetical protein